jgi:hypothetical protein
LRSLLVVAPRAFAERSPTAFMGVMTTVTSPGEVARSAWGKSRRQELFRVGKLSPVRVLDQHLSSFVVALDNTRAHVCEVTALNEELGQPSRRPPVPSTVSPGIDDGPKNRHGLLDVPQGQQEINQFHTGLLVATLGKTAEVIDPAKSAELSG